MLNVSHEYTPAESNDTVLSSSSFEEPTPVLPDHAGTPDSNASEETWATRSPYETPLVISLFNTNK